MVGHFQVGYIMSDTCGAYSLFKHTPSYCISYLKTKLNAAEKQLEEALAENENLRETIDHADRLIESWR